MAISRTDARHLAKVGAEMGARVLRGTLIIDADRATINDINLLEWLADHHGTEFLLIAAPVGRSGVEQEIRTCYTCGRDFTGDRCPHCAEARARLRG